VTADDLCDLLDDSPDRSVDNRAAEILACIKGGLPAPVLETIDGRDVLFVVASVSEPVYIDGKYPPAWAIATSDGSNVVYVKAARTGRTVFFKERWQAYTVKNGAVVRLPMKKGGLA